MACSCNNRSVPSGAAGGAARQAAADRAKAAAESRQAARAANPATTRIGPAKASGQTQTFTLTHDGRTATFGSKLERDAAAARLARQ